MEVRIEPSPAQRGRSPLRTPASVAFERDEEENRVSKEQESADCRALAAWSASILLQLRPWLPPC
jgi:hypothetical protein